MDRPTGYAPKVMGGLYINIPRIRHYPFFSNYKNLKNKISLPQKTLNSPLYIESYPDMKNKKAPKPAPKAAKKADLASELENILNTAIQDIRKAGVVDNVVLPPKTKKAN